MLLKMKIGLSGPERTLAPGDEGVFDDDEGQRLIGAGFADLVPEETLEQRIERLKAELAELEPPVEETPEQRIARLKAELAELEPPAAAPAPAPAKPAAKKG